jgi:DNA-binding MurR/RpiR family transcriptional regulator
MENHITDYIFEDINAVLNMSLIELAEKLYVSKATVTRYYKKLGFESYRDFCVQLAKEAALFESGENKQADLIRQDSTTAEIIQTVASITKQAVNENMKNIRESEIQNFATLIHNYKRIYIYGAGEAGYSASFIFLSRLLELGKVAKTLEEQEYVEQNLALYKDSVVALPKVDAQRRLSIPKEVVEELKLQGHVYVVGAFNSVEIYPSREAYEATLKQKKLK